MGDNLEERPLWGRSSKSKETGFVKMCRSGETVGGGSNAGGASGLGGGLAGSVGSEAGVVMRSGAGRAMGVTLDSSENFSAPCRSFAPSKFLVPVGLAGVVFPGGSTWFIGQLSNWFEI